MLPCNATLNVLALHLAVGSGDGKSGLELGGIFFPHRRLQLTSPAYFCLQMSHFGETWVALVHPSHGWFLGGSFIAKTGHEGVFFSFSKYHGGSLQKKPFTSYHAGWQLISIKGMEHGATPLSNAISSFRTSSLVSSSPSTSRAPTRRPEHSYFGEVTPLHLIHLRI